MIAILQLNFLAPTECLKTSPYAVRTEKSDPYRIYESFSQQYELKSHAQGRKRQALEIGAMH